MMYLWWSGCTCWLWLFGRNVNLFNGILGYGRISLNNASSDYEADATAFVEWDNALHTVNAS